MSHAVIIKNAVKKYGDFTALNGVSLDIKQGEFFTLLGPSGCGKTTLLRMIAGFNTVDGGEICFDDRVINNLEAHKRDIGMVFQNYAIFPHLTVAENVAYGLKAKKCPKDQIPGKVEEALELVQIGKLKDRKPNELSGGQQQRRLPQGQHGGQSQRVHRKRVAQLPAEQRHRQAGGVADGGNRAAQAVGTGSDGGDPQRGGGQNNGGKTGKAAFFHRYPSSAV